MAVQPIPEGYHTITPYLVVPGIAKLIECLEAAFDAKATECHSRPDGTIMHAETRIGDSMVMMGEPQGQWQPMPAALYMYVPDCEAVYRRALEAGATSVMEPADMFYGDRSAGVKDPCGNLWWIGTRTEDLPPDELARRAEAYGKQKR
jgi:PhnB protein